MSGVGQVYSTVQQQDKDPYQYDPSESSFEESGDKTKNTFSMPRYPPNSIVYPQSLELDVTGNHAISIIAADGEPLGDPEHKDPATEKGIIKKPSKLSEPSMITPHNDRKKFIFKVYALLTMQLFTTAIFVSIILAIEPIRIGVRDHYWAVIIAWIMTIFFLLAIFFGRKFMCKYPRNYYAMGTFTLLQSYIVAYFCAKYDPISVLIAALLTLSITIALTIYAFKTKRDFTSMGGIVIVLITGTIFFAFLLIFFLAIWSSILICVLISIVYGVFIIYDTQLIAGGRYSELTYDDYVIGSLILYIDIVGVFIYLLSIIGKRT